MRHLGRLFRVQGQYDKALVDCLEKAEEIARRYKDDAELGRIGHISTVILPHQGRLLEAEQIGKTMLEKGEKLNDLELKAMAAYRISEFESRKQHFDKALEWLDQGEKWCREIGWTRGLAWNMYLRGHTLIQQGNTTSAEPFLMKSLRMATSWGDRRLISRNKHRLAQVYVDTDRLQLARQMAEDTRDLCERLGMAVRLAEVEELLRTLPENNTNK